MEVLRYWEREEIEDSLRKGYTESSDEDLSLAEFGPEAGNEAMEEYRSSLPQSVVPEAISR